MRGKSPHLCLSVDPCDVDQSVQIQCFKFVSGLDVLQQSEHALVVWGISELVGLNFGLELLDLISILVENLNMVEQVINLIADFLWHSVTKDVLLYELASLGDLALYDLDFVLHSVPLPEHILAFIFEIVEPFKVNFCPLILVDEEFGAHQLIVVVRDCSVVLNRATAGENLDEKVLD